MVSSDILCWKLFFYIVLAIVGDSGHDALYITPLCLNWITLFDFTGVLAFRKWFSGLKEFCYYYDL